MKTVPLKRLATFTAGGTPSVDEESYWGTEEIPWVTISDMSSSPVVLETGRSITDAGRTSARLAIGRPGTILFAMYASVGAVATLGIDAAWNQAILGITPRPDVADSRFLSYSLRMLGPQLESLTRSNTQSNLNADQVSNLLVPGIGVREQRTIADFLDAETARIDSLELGARRRQVLVQERHDAARAELVLQGLDPITGAGCKVAWPVTKLGILLALKRGHDLPHESRRSGDVPVVSSGGISGWHDTAACQPPGVVTGRYGTIGEVFLIDEPYWPLNTTLYVSDFRGCDPSWVRHLLGSLPLDAESEKSAVGGIDRKVIGDLRVPAPALQEQAATSRELDHLRSITDRVYANLLEQACLLQERKQALITAAVTGQLDLARDIAEEAS